MPSKRESSSSQLRRQRISKNQPTHEEIALRAYHIYLKRGGAPGNELEDWTRAERELREERTKPHRKATLKLVAA